MLHLKNGSSQKKAFEEAAAKLGRTPGACAFRFNNVLRKQYNEEIRSVSEKVENENTDKTVIQFPKNNNVLSWQQVISFLDSQAVEVLKVQQQLLILQEENTFLRKELEHHQQSRTQLESLGINVSKMLELINHA